MIVKALALALLLPAFALAQTVTVGSKRFTESYILGEILTQAMQRAGEARAVHQQGLGNTAIVFAALKSGAIDLYPEYTGTIAFELLGGAAAADLRSLDAKLREQGLGAAIPLGFNDSYALATTSEIAARYGIRSISDLVRHPGLRLALSQEFLNRKDGWGALKRAYGLPQEPRGLDHGLAHEALAAGRIDVIDAYSTDAKIIRYRLHVLDDDHRVFPRYDAVVLYRLDFPDKHPASWAALKALEGRISTARMTAMNAESELSGRTFGEVAARFLAAPDGAAADPGGAPATRSFVQVLFAPDLPRLLFEHMRLVTIALVPAIALGVPLGVWSAYSRRAGRWILGSVGLLQTIPALALLAFLITYMGTIGSAPAIVALFLYALLPIVRNTASGLADIPVPLREAARALGLGTATRLRRIELPLASRSIVAGVQTSAVISVGTATIAAFVGAGGLGERIVAGLAVNDTLMLLAGAVPSAGLALAVDGFFEFAQRWFVPRGLRLREADGASVEARTL